MELNLGCALREGMRETSGGGDFKYDIFDIL
jgi:hypothetical protein